MGRMQYFWRSFNSAFAMRLPRVLGGTQEMQRYIGLIADNPTVVRFGRDIEDITCPHFGDAAIRKRRRSTPGDYHADMLDGAESLADLFSDVN